MKENIRLAINSGLIDKGSALDALLELVSEDQLGQSPKFSLFYGADQSLQTPVTPVCSPKKPDAPIVAPLSIKEIEGKVKTLFHDAIFTHTANTDFIPAKCRKGRWAEYIFVGPPPTQGFAFFTKALDAFSSQQLNSLMKSNGYNYLYYSPCNGGEWATGGSEFSL